MELIGKEELILRSIFEDYIIQTKVSDKIHPSLFKDKANKDLVFKITEYVKKYKKYPLAPELFYTLADDSVEKLQLVKIMKAEHTKIDRKVVYDQVQNFFREAMTYNILMEAGQLIYENKLEEIGGIVKSLAEAVNLSLTTTTGLNATKDAQEVLNRLSQTHTAIPSSYDALRYLTGTPTRCGGYMRKALSLYQGQPNIGKTIFLCNEAAFAYQKGYNVLYVTLELAEEYILQRIYSNVTDIDYKTVPDSTAEGITKLFKENREKNASVGNIFVKRLPTTATALDIDNLINELKVTEGIDLDFVVVDYLGKLKPVKRKDMANFSHTLYSVGSDVAEQLRDIAELHEVAVLSASQITRDGYDTTDASMKTTAGSAGINDTADLIIRITQDPDLKKLDLFLCFIIKNRFGPNDRTFIIKCDYTHMRARMASNVDYTKYQDSRLNKEKPISDFSIVEPSQITNMAEPNIKNATLIEPMENLPEVKNKHEMQDKNTDIFNMQPEVVEVKPADKIIDSDPFSDAAQDLYVKKDVFPAKNEILLTENKPTTQQKKDPFEEVAF